MITVYCILATVLQFPATTTHDAISLIHMINHLLHDVKTCFAVFYLHDT